MDLSEEDLERMLEKAADKAVEKQRLKIYEETGRFFWKTFLFGLGAVVIAISAWLSAHGGQ